MLLSKTEIEILQAALSLLLEGDDEAWECLTDEEVTQAEALLERLMAKDESVCGTSKSTTCIGGPTFGVFKDDEFTN